MLPVQTSLVKYDNPILVSSKDARGKVRSRFSLSKAIHSACFRPPCPGLRSSRPRPLASYAFRINLCPVSRVQGRKGFEGKSKGTPTEDILNSILPPREWTEDGQLWVQYVSSTPATRSDVIALQEQLDHRLQQRQARETGICPIREELYAQSFDELIRQVTINCAERGLLLLRVRDEIRLTVASYQTLYDSCIAFGMRQALQAEQRKSEKQKRIKELEGEVSTLKHMVLELQQRCETSERLETERRAAASSKYREEVDYLRKHNAELKSTLEAMLSVPSHKGELGGDVAAM